MGFFDKIKQKLTGTSNAEKTVTSPEIEDKKQYEVNVVEDFIVANEETSIQIDESEAVRPSVDVISQELQCEIKEEKFQQPVEQAADAVIEAYSGYGKVDATAEDIAPTTLTSAASIVENTVEQVIEKPTDSKKSFFSKMASAVKSTFGIEKIKDGLSKTRKTFSDNLRKVLGQGKKIDDNLLSDIEELLIMADIGVESTEQIIEALRNRVKKENWENSEDLYNLLREEIQKLLIESPSANNDKIYEVANDNRPYVILVIGVNGVGKTTTIGKLAYNYKNTGKDVIIGAADTFRAAANEQLEIWAERAGVDIVQQHQGADPASVAFDTLKSAQSKNKDVVIIDTAGRLHNKKHLMDELEKITRVMRKLKDNAPDEVFLILDATTGQNAIFQAKEFSKVANVTGIVLTKLDGTAKGGVVIPIANELKIPVRYVGVGEKIEDLQPFDVKAFVDGLFEEEEAES